MTALTESIRAVVLDRDATAGGFERLALLTEDQGLRNIMRRQSSKMDAGEKPDLFDLCTVTCEARQGRACFLREYALERRHGNLGRRYDALESASAWARLILANAPDMDDTSPLFALTLQALEAWERGAMPKLILLKALFVFARNEGLPVREEWLRSLPEKVREQAACAINAAPGCTAPDEAACGELAAGIVRWMCTSHHILPPRGQKPGEGA
jgi:hypothetical protein